MTENAPNIVILLTNGSTKYIKFLKNIVNPTVIAAIIALFGIVRQLKNKNITEERQKWLIKLKDDISKFISLLNYNQESNEKENSIWESEIKELYYRIIFNLNRFDKVIDRKIINILYSMKEAQFVNILEKDIKDLEHNFSNMFKFEWERIKIETNMHGFIPVLRKKKQKKLIKSKKEEILRLSSMDETNFFLK